MNQAERALASTTKEAQRQGNALDKLIGQIDPTVAAYSRLDKMEQQLEAHRKAGRLPTEDYKQYAAQIQATRESIGRTDSVLTKSGVSARQTAAAFGMLPAQLSDIAVQLAGGQNPLLILLQQGSQIKDSFGGIGATFSAFGTRIASFFGGAAAGVQAFAENSDEAAESASSLAESTNTLAESSENAQKAATALNSAVSASGTGILGVIGIVAGGIAALATLAVAYKQGSGEADAFNDALTLTGNAAGTSADQLATQAQAVSKSVGTVGAAAAVLAQLASSGVIPADAFDMIAVAALKMQEATGKAAEETVKDFEKIAKDPAKAIRELNATMNFLTTSTYAQIEALQRQGDVQGAINLAEQTYAEALTSRANKIVENLGYVEGAWLTVKNAAKSAWDSILDVGREATLDEKLSKLRETLAEIHSGGRGGRAQFGLGMGPGGDAAGVEKQITDLLVQQEESRKRSAAAATIVAQDKKGIAAVEALNKGLEETAPKTEKLAKRFAEIDKQVAAAAARGVQYSDAQIAQLRKAAEEQFKAAKTPAVKAVREDAGQKMLDNLRQQAAALQMQSETAEKLGTQAQALAKFQQEIADIKSKDIQTADQKALLASEALITAQLKRNVALEQEVAARKQASEEVAKLAAFQENQASKLNMTQEGLDSQLAGLGMGEKGRERLKEDLAIRKEYQSEVDKLNKQFNTGQISEDLYAQETAILEENLASRLVMQQDYYNQLDEAQSSFFLGASEGWANWAEEATNYSEMAAEFVTGTLDTLTEGLAESFMSILDGTKSVGDAFADLGTLMVKSIVGALAQMAAQWLVYQAVQLLVGKTTQASAATAMAANASAMAVSAGINAFSSTAAIPIVGPLLAPAAMGAALAVTVPMAASVSTLALAGMAHDGIDAVPETGTWLLQKGERVTTAQTSAKLDKTLEGMKSPSGGGNTTVNLIEDASRAGQTQTREEDGQKFIDLWISKLHSDDDVMEALNRKTGIRGIGQ